MHFLSLIAIVAIGTLLSSCAFGPARTASDSQLVAYSEPAHDSLSRLAIRRLTLDDSAIARIANLSRTNSPWGSRWLAFDPADTAREGPWTTRLYIFDETDQRQCVVVEARDHASYGVHYQWLNDRALFVQCYWGRIVSTDFLLDTETARPLYIQDANYLRLILPPQ